MKLILVVAALVACVGCTATSRYHAGENHDRDGNPCGNRQVPDGYVPFCSPPDDGDQWDSRN